MRVAKATRWVSVCLLLAAGGLSADELDKERAPLLDGMGDYHLEISTDDTLAQRLFDQGMVLSYGFNHKEAGRAFRNAAAMDPDCAMAYWGEALVLGPNINMPMMPDNNARAYEAMTKALSLIDNATPREQELIRALQKRYVSDPPEDRAPLDSAYADAMRELAKVHPDDVDILALAAEARMDMHPWDYWLKDGTPQPWTPEILRLLETAMAVNPHHAGANHFYIHATEASDDPGRAVPAADRLAPLAPGAGHLVHMPSHAYIRVGQYHKGTLANEAAIQSDNMYVTQCRQQGIYPLAYVPHNYHFLWTTATLEGASAKAMKAAVEMSHYVDTTTMREHGMGTLQHYWVTPLYGMVRFGHWDDIFEWPEPAVDLRYPRGVWHYARGCAFVARGEFDRAQTELDSVRVIAEDTTLLSITIWDVNNTWDLMRIASGVLAGLLASAQSDYASAINYLNEAVQIEDSLRYNEPPDWHQPVRQVLGAVYLQAGNPGKAEMVYREDLKHVPRNGWSLYGLMQSLEAQGKAAEAEKARTEYNSAWEYADIKLTGSIIM